MPLWFRNKHQTDSSQSQYDNHDRSSTVFLYSGNLTVSDHTREKIFSQGQKGKTNLSCVDMF